MILCTVRSSLDIGPGRNRGVWRCVVERVDVALVGHVDLELLAVEVRAEGFRVQRLEVINVHQIFVNELPVAIEVGDMLAVEAAILQAEEAECVVEKPNVFFEQRCGVVKIDEDPAGPNARAQWFRRQFAGSKPSASFM